jgi:hypothetical protein
MILILFQLKSTNVINTPKIRSYWLALCVLEICITIMIIDNGQVRNIAVKMCVMMYAFVDTGSR